MDKRIEAVCNHSVSHNHYTHRANTGSFAIRCFEIYCCKVFHYDCKYKIFRANMQGYTDGSQRNDVNKSLQIYRLI